jgi:hypothetical protein
LELFLLYSFFIEQFSDFVILLTVLNTLSTAIVDIIIPCTSLVGGFNDEKVEFGSRGRQNLQDIIIFPIKRFKVDVQK